MFAGDFARAVESDAIADLLDAASTAPAGLILEGEAGIGKTTLWTEGIDLARERDFRVLSSRPAAAESVLAYATLADLLGSVNPEQWAHLPAPQRNAVDRVLLRSDEHDAATDWRVVAAAFLAVIEDLARTAAVLLAIDDLQWVDPSSAHVLTFAGRRTTGRIGVLGAVRTGHQSADVAWLQLPRPERLRRVALRPMSPSALHTMVAERLGRSLARPTMLKIHQASGGNPLYALELARSILDDPGGAEQLLPTSLSELVEARVGRVDDPVMADALLAVSCLASPTVEVVAEAVSADHPTLVRVLEHVERQGIITLDGDRIRFRHPLLAKGVYSRAAAADRRAMHRRLAAIVPEPELRARHLALAVTSADPTTLTALDGAAETARMRGAPGASAELTTLAIRLGGDTPERRIRLAGYHFNAGDSEQARRLLETTIEGLEASPLRARANYLLGVVRMYDDSFPDAVTLLSSALDEVVDLSALRAEMLVILAFAQINANLAADAMDSVEEAVSLGDRHGIPNLLSQALGMQVTLRFMAGQGLDRATLDRALTLEDHRAGVPVAIRASVHAALLDAWSGRFVEAGDAFAELRRRCLERGEESEMVFLSFHTALAAIWRADFPAATRAVDDAVERAPLLSGDVPRYVALVTRALLGVHTGDVETARRDATEALAAGVRSGAANLSQWPVMALGFLECSLENHEAALAVLDPLLARLRGNPDSTEIISAWFVPDAVESLVQLGRLADAEPWVHLLERNGTRLDRPWMLAVGSRGRGMLLGARGQLAEALQATEHAMAHHERVTMPFERARTQLLLGQLQRRQRRQDAAATTLREALSTFEDLGTAVWAERARVQLARTNVGPRSDATLTPSERRVAELAAAGMTNRDVATALFVSPKTVEANLSRVYHKLGIHSRAELGRRMGELAD